MRLGVLVVCALGIAWVPSHAASEWKVGIARQKITPDGPIRMSGYAVRTKPSEGVEIDLWAKALAMEDGRGERFVLVTMDSLTIPGSVRHDVLQQLSLRDLHLSGDKIAINASHTHAGPMVGDALYARADTAEEQRAVAMYTVQLTSALARVIDEAVRDLKPGELAFSKGSAEFAKNRRQFTDKGLVNGINPNGPVDHDVPVITAVRDGKIAAVVFGYACHNTTTQGDFQKISGDYAGFAQLAVAEKYPGATAMFVILCAGDQNPQPRGKLELAKQHGRELADAVHAAIASGTKPLHGPLRSKMAAPVLTFQKHTRETYESRLGEKDEWRVKHAKYMLSLYDAKRPIRNVAYPVQAVRFGPDLLWIFLGGEVVVDYCVRVKREYPDENVFVAGYSNNVMGYIPSLRILKEGGYEADSSMIYYGLPGPYTEDVEERIFDAIHTVVKATR